MEAASEKGWETAAAFKTKLKTTSFMLSLDEMLRGCDVVIMMGLHFKAFKDAAAEPGWRGPLWKRSSKSASVRESGPVRAAAPCNPPG